MSDAPNDAHVPDAHVVAWFAGRLPDEWTAAGEPELTVDREEVTVVITIAEPELADDADGPTRAEAVAGASAGSARTPRATHRDRPRGRAPVRTKGCVGRAGRRPDRAVHSSRRPGHDPVASARTTCARHPRRAGVARSRADALAWCVRLVGQHTDDWLAKSRAAIADVERLHAEGPDTA